MSSPAEQPAGSGYRTAGRVPTAEIRAVSHADWRPRKRVRAGNQAARVDSVVRALGLDTVCVSARCPNQPECWAAGTATFLLLGSRCTRGCRFCAVQEGGPLPVRSDEPEAVGEACVRLGLDYVVLTSVTRDDLPDGGAGVFARAILAVRRSRPECAVEVLVPDFGGSLAALETVLAAGPAVFSHNLEMAPRLYPALRPQADYGRSLGLLRAAGRTAARAGVLIKTGLMVGLGETDGEVGNVLREARQASCQLVTIGQYLPPSPQHAPLARVVSPACHAEYVKEAETLGFLAVQSGTFVRSSYRAAAMLTTAREHVVNPG
jgi:lipoyl synthase